MPNSDSQILRLEPDEVHVWVTEPENLCTPPNVRRYYEILGEDERQRYARFVFEKDRNLYLVAHAQVRTLLSRYHAADPRDWRFSLNAYGRPAVSHPAESRWLHFNLSHTKGLIASAFARQPEVGVDVEHIDRRTDTLELAHAVFAPAEVESLKCLGEEERRRRFFKIWTLKESYIKARGMGLSLALDGFWFEPDAGGILVEFAERLGDTAAAWQFQLFQPTENHQMAVAVKAGPGRRFAVTVRNFVP